MFWISLDLSYPLILLLAIFDQNIIYSSLVKAICQAAVSPSTMDSSKQLVWKTEPAERARRIALEAWQKHEVELRALYESKTLGDVMKEMGEKHNFWPS